jgi:hypothetical protein
MAPLLISAGISLAVGLASNVLISLLTPAQKIEGQRLNDLSAPKSNWGTQIPWIWGSVRVSGNVIWADDIEEVVAKKRSGGKGLGPKISQTTYSYYGSFAVLLCRGPIVGVRRLWLNSKLVVDLSDTADSETVVASLKFLDDYVRVYLGTDTQMPDPMIQTKEGVDNTPAHRNNAYLAFERLPLTEDYGSQIPAVSAEVVTCGVSAGGRVVQGDANLAGIINRICNEVGLSVDELDLSEIDQPVTGFWINTVSEAREHLRVLQQGYFFDVVETGGRLRFINQQRPGVTQTIELERLGSHEFGQTVPERFEETRIQDTELPRQVTMKFLDPNVEYREATQMSPIKAGTYSQNEDAVTVPIVFSASEGKTIADKLLFLAWLKRRSFKFTLMPSHGLLDPGDLVEVPFYGDNTLVQLTKVSLGANLLMECEAQAYDGHIFDHSVTVLQSYSECWVATKGVTHILAQLPIVKWDSLTGSGGSPTYIRNTDYTVNLETAVVTILSGGQIENDATVCAYYYAKESAPSQALKLPGDTVLKVLDIPLVTDGQDEYGVLIAGRGGGSWRNAALWGAKGDDLEYDFILNLLTNSTMGTCATILGAATPFVLDEASALTVALDAGELVSVTTDQLLRGKNTALVGQEIIRFREAVLTATRTYRLTGLVRGARGTEWAIAAHQANEPFVLLEGGYIEQVTGVAADIGVALNFKAPTSGQTLDEVTPTTITPVPMRLKPWAPANVNGVRDSGGNLTISWVRRDRRAGELPLFADKPMSETSERYEVDIMNGLIKVRTLVSAASFVMYLAADQVADFGVVQNNLSVRICQMSAVVGRGFEARATV